MPRSANTTFTVKIGEKFFDKNDASENFYDVINYVSKKIGIDKFIEEVCPQKYNFVSVDMSNLPTYRKSKLNKLDETGQFYIFTHSNTDLKINFIETLLKKYELKGTIEKVDKISDSENSNTIKELRSEFWSNFLTKINDVSKIYSGRTKGSEQWMSGTTGVREVHLNSVISSKYAKIELWISRTDKNENKKIFDFIFSNKEKIEKNFGQCLNWSRLDDKRSSTISFEISIDSYDKNNWESIFDFFITNFPKFENTFKAYINSIPELLSDTNFDISVPDKNLSKIIMSKVTNPFGAEKESSAICVTGDSGAGKSYRVEQTLIKYNHKFIFETLDPTSTGLLTQYVSGKYERNNIGEFIVSAKNDSQNFYTIVLDECHKDGFIDRINAELLQCFSTKRNNGLRFFSTNKSTDRLFSELDEKNGRRVIPDNLGFILITSKADIIENNDDIRNRVDIINLEKEDREKSFDINFLIKTKEIIVNQFENQD